MAGHGGHIGWHWESALKILETSVVRAITDLSAHHDSHVLFFFLFFFQGHFGLSKTEELELAIGNCKELIQSATQNSDRQKNLVRKLVQLRLKLQEMKVTLLSEEKLFFWIHWFCSQHYSYTHVYSVFHLLMNVSGVSRRLRSQWRRTKWWSWVTDFSAKRAAAPNITVRSATVSSGGFCRNGDDVQVGHSSFTYSSSACNSPCYSILFQEKWRCTCNEFIAKDKFFCDHR